MLILLIVAVVWIAVASCFVALCRGAGRADERLMELAVPNGQRAFLADVVLTRDAPVLAARDTRPSHARLARPSAGRAVL